MPQPQMIPQQQVNQGMQGPPLDLNSFMQWQFRMWRSQTPQMMVQHPQYQQPQQQPQLQQEWQQSQQVSYLPHPPQFVETAPQAASQAVPRFQPQPQFSPHQQQQGVITPTPQYRSSFTPVVPGPTLSTPPPRQSTPNAELGREPPKLKPSDLSMIAEEGEASNAEDLRDSWREPQPSFL